jgi:hypothetical protein
MAKKRRAEPDDAQDDDSQFDTPKPKIPTKKERKPNKTSKTKKPNATEKRGGARFRSVASAKTSTRLQRAVSQRMYVVDKRKLSDTSMEYRVLGSTGNLYKIVMGPSPSCNCPDAMKGNNPCKHSLFVRIKVLKIDDNDPMMWQVGYTDEELKKVFATDLLGDHVVSQKVRDLLKGSDIESAQDEGRKAISAEDSCAICYDSLSEAEALVWCRGGCGNNVHKACFAIWSQNCHRGGVGVTCVYCRAPWTNAAAAGTNKEGYVNMAAAVGLSQVRDVSTYYQGPVRGQGVREYDDEGHVYMRRGRGR